MPDTPPWLEYQQAAPIPLAGPDPDLAVQRALRAAELQAKARAAASAPFDLRKSAADARRAEIDADKAARDAKAGGTRLTAEARGKLVGQREVLPLVEQRINELEKLYDENFSGTGLGALKEYLPGSIRPVNQTLDDAANSLLGPLGQAFGITAQQSNTPLELQLRFGPYLPQHGIRDEANRARIQRLREVVANQKKAVAQQLGETDEDRDQLAPPAVTTPPPVTPPDFSQMTGDGPQTGLAGGPLLSRGFRNEYDPQTTATLDRAIHAGLPLAQAQAMMPEGGEPIDPKTYAAAVAYARQHPEYKKSLAEATKSVPTTFLQRLSSSPAGAFASGAGNAAIAGYSDELAGRISQLFGGDYEKTRDEFNASKNLLAAEHPVADFGGNVAGAASSMLAATKFPGVMAALSKAPRIAPLAADVAYGVAYGSGQNNEDRLGGGLMGAGTALAAGPLARAGMRGVGNMVGGPVLQPAVQRLIDKGFILSPAQRATGNRSFFNLLPTGAMRRRVDDALRSSPLVGDAITAQGGRQYAQLGRATVEEALAPVGAKVPKELTGNNLMGYANDQVSQAYDRALPGIRAPLDDAFITANNEIRASAATLPEAERSLFDTIYSRAVKPFIPSDGVLTGEALQDIKRGLDKKIMGLNKSGDPAKEYLADELTNLRGIFFDWASRAAPEKVGEFRAANAAFANMVRVNRAAAAAKKDGIFSPDQLLGAIKANSSDAQFASGGLPMQELGQDAQQILPSTLPESGTVPRAMINTAGLSAAGGGAALAPSVSPLLALPIAKAAVHAPGVDRMLQALALRRSAALARAGRAIRKRQRLGSAVAVPLAVENATVDR